jgi:DNA-binding transcriptional LysR family regulator
MFCSLWDSAPPLVASGQLVPLPEAWMPHVSDRFFLYYLSRRWNLAPVRVLADFLHTNIKTGVHAAPNGGTDFGETEGK